MGREIMAKKLFVLALVTLLGFGLGTSTGFVAEKLKFASSYKYNPVQYLPILAAQEMGFWKQNGLDVEWVPFKAGGDMSRAMAAAHINIGIGTAVFVIRMAARALPVVMVSEVDIKQDWSLWVLPDSPLKGLKDLKGRKLGISRKGAVDHAIAKVAAKLSGFEQDVRIVALGRITVKVAALKTGKVDAITSSARIAAGLSYRGEVRLLISMTDYLPKPWMERVVLARREFTKDKPDTTRKAVRAILQATQFIRKNPQWTIKKLKSNQKIVEGVARLIYSGFAYTEDGKIDGKAVKNVKSFLIQYGIIPETAAPRVDVLYTNQFVD